MPLLTPPPRQRAPPPAHSPRLLLVTSPLLVSTHLCSSLHRVGTHTPPPPHNLASAHRHLWSLAPLLIASSASSSPLDLTWIASSILPAHRILLPLIASCVPSLNCLCLIRFWFLILKLYVYELYDFFLNETRSSYLALHVNCDELISWINLCWIMNSEWNEMLLFCIWRQPCLGPVWHGRCNEEHAMPGPQCMTHSIFVLCWVEAKKAWARSSSCRPGPARLLARYMYSSSRLY
jgi:hypothetical protein